MGEKELFAEMLRTRTYNQSNADSVHKMTPQLKEGFNNGIMHVRAHSSIQEGSTKSR